MNASDLNILNILDVPTHVPSSVIDHFTAQPNIDAVIYYAYGYAQLT